MYKLKTFITCIALCLCSMTVFAQTSVTGNVSDLNGEAVIGASILEKGTTNGTITDIDGNFTLNVSPGATLQISYIGYITQEVPVTGRSLAIILEEDTQTLDEVVVVGYGTQKRSDITGSVTSVPKERLSNLPVQNIAQSIQGVAAGVNITQTSSVPGDAASIVTRGRSSVNLSNSPLIVVDGVAMSVDASLNDVNPNDIESIEILKDASSVAIYGVQGANGVILITTKRGASAKPTVRYGGWVGFSEIAHVLEPGSTDQLLERYAEYARIQNKPLNPDYGGVQYAYEVDNFRAGKTIDWIDEVTQQGIIQNHNLSISGGDEAARYYVAGDFMDQQGVVKGYNYKRYAVRSNIDVKPTKYATIGSSLSITAHNRDGGRANLLNAAAMSPYAKMYEDDGVTYTHYPMYAETLWANPLLNTTLNPKRRSFNISVNGYGEIDFGNLLEPLAGLKYRLNGGYTYIPTRNNYYEGESVYNENGYGYIYNSESQYYLIENILSYAKDIQRHHFDFTGLFSASSKYWQEAYAYSRMFPNDNLGWGNLETGSTQSVSSEADLRRLQSLMGRLNYNYDSRYLFTATVRRDASSVFGDDTKWGTFPSFAIGWNVTREEFAQPITNVLNSLKLRTSYGYSGNASLPVYSSFFKLTSNTLAMDGSTTTTMKVGTRMGNSSIQWERTKSLNIAADFGLWSNRLNGTIEWYDRTTDGVLLLQSLNTISGFADVWDNIGVLNNKGIELTLNSTNIDTKDFRWNTTLVFSKNTSKWVDVYGDGKSDLSNRWFIGKPFGVIYDYTKVGIWQEDEIGKPVAEGGNIGWDDSAVAGDLKLADIGSPDADGDGLPEDGPDGKIDDNDRRVLGTTQPKWTGGLTNTFTYKNFSLSVFIQTVQGVMSNNGVLATASDELGRRNGPAEVGFWTPENKSNEWRSLGNHSNSHGYGFPSDASYTRIKDVTLSYRLPKSLLNKAGLGDVQFYVSGRNLYTFTNWIGWDPEARYITRGSTNWDVNYPVTRDIVFGLNVTF
ncbi:SusC/RagA family TonB-linked outer membrane protein [Proteiniphilum acetatigenes]|uniref:SusC/RagA family TonB-linked outer membrane protein n=1 Tax=Proteiniphilum acetatigenes TaxID=294710 RepID=UPI0012F9C196|nr:TonB-dependent receptor [Proteiniphilum acetatigenes]